MGYQISLNLKVIISIDFSKQNMKLKIKILAGNTLMSRFHVGFEIDLPLVSICFNIFLQVATMVVATNRIA